MTMTTQETVVSGHGYTITEVDGQPPTGLADCVGEHAARPDRERPVAPGFGTGTAIPGGVRFHQKDLGPDGKDVGSGRSATLDHAPLIARHRARPNRDM